MSERTRSPERPGGKRPTATRRRKCVPASDRREKQKLWNVIVTHERARRVTSNRVADASPIGARVRAPGNSRSGEDGLERERDEDRDRRIFTSLAYRTSR